MSEHVLPVTDETFKTDVLQSSIPVLVDFWAEWCGPCRAVAPVLEEIAKEYASKIKIVKCNVDENAKMAAEYGIQSIPTFILFKDGEKKEARIGGASKSQLMAFIDAHL